MAIRKSLNYNPNLAGSSERGMTGQILVPLADSILTIIDAAPKYAEGRGVRIEVRIKKDLAAVKDMAKVKMAN